MLQLPQVIPDPDLLLALEPEELATKLLFLLRQRGEMFHPGGLQNELCGDPSRGQPGYLWHRVKEIGDALTEAWAWLEAQGLVVPEDGTNGQNGWRRLSRRARRTEGEADFASFKIARLLPREILHPKIADPVWRAYMRGEFDVAAFQAMKAVEVSVRDASQLDDSIIGVNLMRAAFNPKTGPLTDKAAEAGVGDSAGGAVGRHRLHHPEPGGRRVRELGGDGRRHPAPTPDSSVHDRQPIQGGSGRDPGGRHDRSADERRSRICRLRCHLLGARRRPAIPSRSSGSCRTSRVISGLMSSGTPRGCPIALTRTPL